MGIDRQQVFKDTVSRNLKSSKDSNPKRGSGQSRRGQRGKVENPPTPKEAKPPKRPQGITLGIRSKP